MGNWQQVSNLLELTLLNLKITMDALDDAIEYLVECQEKLEKALGGLHDFTDGLISKTK